MSLAVTSPLLEGLGFRHGFSLRTGGVSGAPFDTLNLGRVHGDDQAHVTENHRLLAQAVGYEAERIYEASQVHGRTVCLVSPGDDRRAVRKMHADALVASSNGVAVGVRVADCIPVLFADPDSGAVAAVHAGWRGVVARVADAALDALTHRAGAGLERVVAAIGPHLRACCFEVGEDVAARIADVAHGVDVVEPRSPRPHVDLTAALRAQLHARGIHDSRIDDVGGCTRCDAARFYSYRRDGERSGRHLAVIVAR